MDGLEEREWELDGLCLGMWLAAGGMVAVSCALAFWLEWEEVESALLACVRSAIVCL